MPEPSFVGWTFDKTAVQRLVDHARTAPEHLPLYGELAKRAALWIVGDEGIYLMSNGSPALMAVGELDRSGGGPGRRWICYANYCSPDDPPDYWAHIHKAVRGGNDFVIAVDALANLQAVIDRADDVVVIVTDGAACQAYTADEFTQGYNGRIRAGR